MPAPYYYGSAAATAWLTELGGRTSTPTCGPLAARLRAGLSAIPGLSIESPADPEVCTGVVTFQVDVVDGSHVFTACASAASSPGCYAARGKGPPSS